MAWIEKLAVQFLILIGHDLPWVCDSMHGQLVQDWWLYSILCE